VFCAGGPARASLPDIPDDAIVFAADAGVAEAERRGLHVDVLVGDLDSAEPDAVARVEAAGGTIRRFPTDKDASDLELAIEAAVAAEVRRIVVVGGDRGRLDHLLGNVFLLASDRWRGVEIDAVLGAARASVIRDDRTLEGTPGDLLSLYAVGGPAHGVTTTGLRWSLEDARLQPGSSLGLSNEFVERTATVRVADGVLLAIRPGNDDAS
jgi:thiamine pyrophosphokinase